MYFFNHDSSITLQFPSLIVATICVLAYFVASAFIRRGDAGCVDAFKVVQCVQDEHRHAADLLLRGRCQQWRAAVHEQPSQGTGHTYAAATQCMQKFMSDEEKRNHRDGETGALLAGTEHKYADTKA